MPKRSNDFQKLVLLINACLQKSGQVNESVLLIDNTTGEKREVDIVLSSSIADYAVNISVEVIDRKRKADVQWVEQMYAKHCTLSTNKLVLVSRNGFYEPALKKAAFYGIEAITFDEALETDWDLAIRMLSNGFFEITTFHYICSVECAALPINKAFNPIALNTTIFLPNQDNHTNFENMVLFFLNEPCVKEFLYLQVNKTNEHNFVLVYTPPIGTYILDENQVQMPILELSVKLEIDHKKTPITYSIGRYGEKKILLGSSSMSEKFLYYVLIKKDETNVEGLLYNENGIRQLKLSRVSSIT